MDDHLRELERRAQTGDVGAAELLVCAKIRSGAKQLIHGWDDYTSYAQVESLNISQQGPYWVVTYQGANMGHFATRDEAYASTRELMDICPYCKTEFPENSTLCCHCIRDSYENFDDCKLCNAVLCTEDPCIACRRIESYKTSSYPDLYRGRRVIWLGEPGRKQYCGMCATSESASGDTEIEGLVYPSILFRCDSCGLKYYPDPKFDDH